ncbi:hypothetical protein FHS18_005337 [Paenibacillus phyllosphaerae]|uniref:DUF3995 domain-containing protein n=1 Tax=Paenibacillus phyllosphaerae TaxID=274593 RepID=A0A7W5FQN6_9BACL|nr:DUF3995 domain-containing protein [Paenibacillus phyllosphaerae]MBB3113234.1 hypothetical protein [Paenibacillus phyllosphaerae]
MSVLLSIVAGGILLIVSGVHVYWAFGGTSGAAAALPSSGGNPLFVPRMPETLAVAVLLALAACVLLGIGDVLPTFLPAWAYEWGGWLLGAVFALRTIGDFRWVGLFKTRRGTTFAHWDTRFYSPLCLVLAAIALWLQIAE